MKICFVTNNISDKGGQQRVTANLVNLLAESNDVSILFYSNKDKSNEFAYPLDSSVKILWDAKLVRKKNKYLKEKLFTKFYQYGYKIKNNELAKKLIFSKKEIELFQEVLGNENFDVIISLAPYASAILSQTKLNAKKIGWMHNTYDRYFNTSNDYLWNLGDIYNYVLKDLDHLVVLTDRASYEYSEKISTDITRIYNPLSFESEKKSNLNNNKILFVGRINYTTKGLDLLIESVNYLKNNYSDFQLVIVGTGNGIKRLREQIVEHNLQNYIKLIGEVSNVIDYYCDARLLVVPSKIEGFGLVLTEAMECGLPVVSYKTEGPSEIIDDGKDGFLIEKFNTQLFAEKILQLMKNKNLNKKMSSEAQNKAKKFNSITIKNEWESLLQKLVEGKNA